MTPLDVVKVRLQAQQKNADIMKKCFLYCNGLMDHICPCISSNEPTNIRSLWYSKPGHFSGTLVSSSIHHVSTLSVDTLKFFFAGCLPQNNSIRRYYLTLEWTQPYVGSRLTSHRRIFCNLRTAEKSFEKLLPKSCFNLLEERR